MVNPNISNFAPGRHPVGTFQIEMGSNTHDSVTLLQATKFAVFEGGSSYFDVSQCPSFALCENIYVEENGNKMCLKCDWASVWTVKSVNNTPNDTSIKCQHGLTSISEGYKLNPNYPTTQINRRKVTQLECLDGINENSV